MSTSELFAAALALPEAERERWAMELWDSLSRDEGIDGAWAAEIERRVQSIQAGEVELVDHEAARRRVLARLDALTAHRRR